MNTWNEVSASLKEWKRQGLAKSTVAVRLANACLGWAYVYGGRGEECTPANRREFYNSKKVENIRSNCKNFDGQGACQGCKWYPGGTTLFYDCRGFTYWVLLKAAGIKLEGAGATSQWNAAGNWEEKGSIDTLPKDRVCCIFRYDSSTKKMEHTLLYDGEGHYIHCSGEVKKCDISKYKATHWAIPKGLGGKAQTGSGQAQQQPAQPAQKTPAKGEAIVTGKRVALREGPGTDCGVILRVDTGEAVKQETVPAGWAYVSYKGKKGFMMKEFLKEG